MKNITIGGRLTRDSELKDVNGTPLLRFSVAVDDRQQVNGQWEKQALFFECSWWGPRAAKAHQFMLKARSVCATGEFSVREYDKNDGTRGHSLVVRVDNVTFMGGREEGASGGDQGGGRYAGQGKPISAGGEAPAAPDFDDIPF